VAVRIPDGVVMIESTDAHSQRIAESRNTVCCVVKRRTVVLVDARNERYVVGEGLADQSLVEYGAGNDNIRASHAYKESRTMRHSANKLSL
jgi:hypothetical protein